MHLSLLAGLVVLAVACGPVNAASDKIVCYYTNWATYRRGDAKYDPKDIDPALCTHLIYSFAVLDANTLLMKPHDPQLDLEDNGGRGFYKQVVGMKSRNQNLKVLIAIGGWTDSKEGDKYSRMVADKSRRSAFIREAVNYLKRHSFDGLDLDWEYPGAGDKANFATFVKELKEEFKKYNYLVTIAVAASPYQSGQSYDIPSLSRDLDQIHVMAYDYHGSWERNVNHHAPLYSNDELNDDSVINHWLKNGAPASKLVLGMPMYGKSWTLANPSQTGIGAAATGPAQAGPYTGEGGMLAYYEICEKGWKVVTDPSGKMGPYAYGQGQWVGYDDQAMIRKKSEYVKSKGLGGAMIWCLDQDDFSGKFCNQGRYPLLSTIKAVILGGGGSTGTGTSGGGGPVVRPPTEKPTIPGGNGAAVTCSVDGFYRHPTDCNKFIQCVGGSPHNNACPPGLQFNPSCNCCDWPDGSCK